MSNQEKLHHLTSTFACYQASNRLNKRLLGATHKVNTAPSMATQQPKMRVRA